MIISVFFYIFSYLWHIHHDLTMCIARTQSLFSKKASSRSNTHMSQSDNNCKLLEMHVPSKYFMKIVTYTVPACVPNDL